MSTENVRIRNNRYETLRLAGKKADSRQQAAAAEASPPPTELSKKLGDYRRQILNKPSSFAKLLRIRPAVKNGALIGYRVQPGRDTAAFTALGLQHGDILTSVNGTALESSVKGLRVLQQLTDAKHVDVEILRNGMSLSLSFTIED